MLTGKQYNRPTLSQLIIVASTLNDQLASRISPAYRRMDSSSVSRSHGNTEGVTAFVSLGSYLFGVMTAGIDIGISSSYLVTSSTGISVKIDCGNSPSGVIAGVIAWFPLFDY